MVFSALVQFFPIKYKQNWKRTLDSTTPGKMKHDKDIRSDLRLENKSFLSNNSALRNRTRNSKKCLQTPDH